jgi:hypothetical protein
MVRVKSRVYNEPTRDISSAIIVLSALPADAAEGPSELLVFRKKKKKKGNHCRSLRAHSSPAAPSSLGWRRASGGPSVRTKSSGSTSAGRSATPSAGRQCTRRAGLTSAWLCDLRSCRRRLSGWSLCTATSEPPTHPVDLDPVYESRVSFALVV